MKKLIAGLVGLGLLGQTYIADCASRKELNIPENGNVVYKGECEPNVWCIQYDNGIQEAYKIVVRFGDGGVLRSPNPFGLWYDRNKNEMPDDDELYFSRDVNEDWEVYKNKSKIDI